MRLHIRCVSVYAFSIENFKRSPEEVDALMTLAKTRLAELCEHGYELTTHHSPPLSTLTCTSDLLQEHGVRLNVLGRTSMLPEDVLEAVRKAEELTKNNDKCESVGLFLGVF